MARKIIRICGLVTAALIALEFWHYIQALA